MAQNRNQGGSNQSSDGPKDALSNKTFHQFTQKFEVFRTERVASDKGAGRINLATLIMVSSYTLLTVGILAVSKCTLNTENDNLYFGQRASIILSDLKIAKVSFNNALLGYLISPAWQNVGGTQASNVHYKSNYLFTHDPPPKGFTKNFANVHDEGPIAVGPKETLSFSGSRNLQDQLILLPEGCLLDVMKGKFKYVNIWGDIRYHDVLRPDKDRETSFCWRLYGTGQTGSNTYFVHFPCDEGNCQDGSCERDSDPQPPQFPMELCEPIPIPVGASIQPPQSIRPPNSQKSIEGTGPTQSGGDPPPAR